MRVTNISEAKANLSSLIRQVQGGSRVIIGKAGKPVAMLVPFDGSMEPRKLGGSWRGKVRMAADFDELPPVLRRAFGGDE